jgi:hypothetical protein
MVWQKLDSKEAEESAGRVYRQLRKAYSAGLLSEAEYDRWYEKYLVARTEKDCK